MKCQTVPNLGVAAASLSQRTFTVCLPPLGAILVHILVVPACHVWVQCLALLLIGPIFGINRVIALIINRVYIL